MIWFYGLEPLIVIHHPTKFGDYKNCGSGAMTILVVEGQDQMPSLQSAIIRFS